MKTADLLLVGLMIVGAACGDTDTPMDAGPVDAGADSSRDSGPDMPAPLDLGTDAPDAGPGLPPGIVSLDGRDPSLPTDDLAALGRLIGDASVVALGESVHTTRGYSEMKDRIFRYLVTELGFRVFAFENPRTQAEAVGEYVATCEGDARSVVSSSLFGVWANESVVTLAEWMCGWNTEHPDDPVRFIAFDMQQPWHDFPVIGTFLADVAPDMTPLFDDLSTCNGIGFTTGREFAESEDPYLYGPLEHTSCLAAFERLDAYLSTERTALVTLTDEARVRTVELASLSARAWQDQTYYFFNNTLNPLPDGIVAFEARDTAMAQIFLRQREVLFPGQRTAIWAHNAHIARAYEAMAGRNAGWRNMGSHLSESLGDDYFSLMLTGHSVSINWPNVGTGPVAPVTDTHSLEGQLHVLERPFLLLDMKAATADLPFDPSIRLVFAHFFGFGVPEDQFDAVVYLDDVPQMRALNW